MKIKNSLTRLNSCIPLNYHRGMDSYDILIEDSLQSKTRVEPELQNEFFEKAWVCFDLCVCLIDVCVFVYGSSAGAY